MQSIYDMGATIKACVDGAAFRMDVEICDQCGGGIKVIACIEDPTVIKKILDHMNSKAAVSEKKRLPQSRAPP
ncbi:MAG: hypothetical protein ACI9LY_003369, partial [Arenicella sp.]